MRQRSHHRTVPSSNKNMFMESFLYRIIFIDVFTMGYVYALYRMYAMHFPVYTV